MRTTPAPSADLRLPRMAIPGRAFLVIWCSFVRVSPGPLRCAGPAAAAPTRPGTGLAIHRPRRAARGEDRRPAAAPPGEPRPAPPPEAPGDAGIRRGEQLAAAPPALPPLPRGAPERARSGRFETAQVPSRGAGDAVRRVGRHERVRKNSPVIKPASNNQWATTAPARLRVRKRRSANITPPAKSPAKARPMAGTICHGLVKLVTASVCT